MRLSVMALITLCTSAIAADNVRSGKHKQEGWLLLFDGETTKGWMSPREKPVDGKHVQDYCLNPHPCDYLLVHEKVWENYKLSLDFKISKKCNSGIFVRTFPLTPRPGKDVGFNGIEIAIDNSTSAGFHDTGAIYDLVKPNKNAMKTVGEWNLLVITSDRNLVEVELNGENVNRVDFDEWLKPNERPDSTDHKFDVAYKTHPRAGYLSVQDHGSDCWYKNMKLLPLK